MNPVYSHLAVLVVGFVGGLLVGSKNSAKVALLEQKAKDAEARLVALEQKLTNKPAGS